MKHSDPGDIQEDWELELQQALAEMPAEKAPAGLRRKLRRIPRQQRALQRPVWFLPGWAAGLAVVPLVVGLALFWNHTQNLQQEVAQGRRDLALALAYLEKTNQVAAQQVMSTIECNVTRTVTNQTFQTLEQPLEMTREYEL